MEGWMDGNIYIERERESFNHLSVHQVRSAIHESQQLTSPLGFQLISKAWGSQSAKASRQGDSLGSEMMVKFNIQQLFTSWNLRVVGEHLGFKPWNSPNIFPYNVWTKPHESSKMLMNGFCLYMLVVQNLQLSVGTLLVGMESSGRRGYRFQWFYWFDAGQVIPSRDQTWQRKIPHLCFFSMKILKIEYVHLPCVTTRG